MDADEKLTELKKAYADMLLNTAKEAAARIMMTERKAHRLEFELKDSKENALQMLTRLKQMMDSKINEAEVASRIQQKKIEELEAQLQEAEDIVKDLREELSSMQAELERARLKNEVNPVSIVFPPTDIQNSDKDQSSKGQISYNSLFPFRKSYIHDKDLPAIILRSKGRKSYRSGYTHRIHACERTTPCEQPNAIKPDLVSETDEEGEKLHKEPSHGDERKTGRKRVSPNRKKRTLCLLDQVEEIDHVVDNSCSIREDSMVRVSDVHSRLRELLLVPMEECEKTKLPLTSSEAPVESKTVETPPIQLTSGRVIRFTFQRKRKRGNLSTDVSDSDNKLKKKEEDKNALLETEKVIFPQKSTQEETDKVKSIEELTHGENEKAILIEELTQKVVSTEEETQVAKQRLIALAAKLMVKMKLECHE